MKATGSALYTFKVSTALASIRKGEALSHAAYPKLVEFIRKARLAGLTAEQTATVLNDHLSRGDELIKEQGLDKNEVYNVIIEHMTNRFAEESKKWSFPSEPRPKFSPNKAFTVSLFGQSFFALWAVGIATSHVPVWTIVILPFAAVIFIAWLRARAGTRF
ncbi:MAG: hypothetical protein U1E25_11230 [Methylocystis sp.]